MRRNIEQIVRNLCIGIPLFSALTFGMPGYVADGSNRDCNLATLAAQRTMSKANKLLLDFPDEIPGARSIKKYPVADAAYTLVHIRQMHLINFTPDSDLEGIKEVQDDIYSSLLYLIDKGWVRHVYTEGIAPETLQYENLLIKLHNGHDKDTVVRNIIGEEIRFYKTILDDKDLIYLFDPRSNSLEEKKKDLKDIIDQKQKELSKPTVNIKRYESKSSKKIKYNGAYRLAAEGKLKLLAAEDMFENLKAAFGEGYEDDREDAFLPIAAWQDEPLIVAVYGGLHAWGGKRSCGSQYSLTGRNSIKDNIAEWNLLHPDKKFSLIEITPTRYNDLL